MFSSDCLKNAPLSVFEHLTYLIKSFLIHSHVSNGLLLAILIPIPKDKLGDLTSSNNYRSIALSSLILKIFDWIIILLFGKTLGLDDLQFGYQKNCSTTMCPWMVIESISYFTRNGSDVFTCAMDMTKAFDMVRHSLMFKKLLCLNFSLIFTRLLIKMYTLQYANVRWQGKNSRQFHISNGVKQGAVLSAILYCIYVNGLFEKLRQHKTGCWINGAFVGILGYADDNFLLSPTLEGLQDMLNTCADYASEHNLTFSTNEDTKKRKTKCMAFLHKKRYLKELTLCGKKLSWVEYVKHLGNTIVNNVDDMSQDAAEKRAQYIARNNELLQEFSFAHPNTKCLINNIFNTLQAHHCGICSIKQLKSWKNVERLPKNYVCITQRNPQILNRTKSKTRHIKLSLMRRYIRFANVLLTSEKKAARNLFNCVRKDCQSITRYNLRKIMLHNADLVDDVTKIPYYIMSRGASP